MLLAAGAVGREDPHRPVRSHAGDLAPLAGPLRRLDSRVDPSRANTGLCSKLPLRPSPVRGGEDPVAGRCDDELADAESGATRLPAGLTERRAAARASAGGSVPFAPAADASPDLYREPLRAEIDAINDFVYPNLPGSLRELYQVPGVAETSVNEDSRASATRGHAIAPVRPREPADPQDGSVAWFALRQTLECHRSGVIVRRSSAARHAAGRSMVGGASSSRRCASSMRPEDRNPGR